MKTDVVPSCFARRPLSGAILVERLSENIFMDCIAAIPFQRQGRLRVKPRDSARRQPPVVLRPVPGEILLSRIARHAASSEVSPRAMLRHADPNARYLRVAHDHLPEEQGDGLLIFFSVRLSIFVA